MANAFLAESRRRQTAKAMTIAIASRLRLLVIGPPSFVDEGTRTFWDRSGVDFTGPYPADVIEELDLDCTIDGAVIDVGYDADTLLRCIEFLDEKLIPAVFATPASRSIQLRGGFVLSGNHEDRDAILGQLMGQKNTTLH